MRDLIELHEQQILDGWREVNARVRNAKVAADEAVEERAAYASAALATGKVTQAKLGAEIGVSRERVKAMAKSREERSKTRHRARRGAAGAPA